MFSSFVMTGRWQSLKQNFLKCLIEKLTRFVWSHYLLFVCMLWFFFQVSWLQVLLLLLQVLCAIKVINKELSFPFLWQHKIVSLKGDWHGGGEKTKQIGTFYRKIFLLWVSEHWVPAWSVSVVLRSRFAHNFQFTNLTSVRVQKRFYDL